MSSARNVAVDDLKVRFPFDPYEEQLQYMRDLLGVLKTGKNAAFEAPTGFGKTLCLTSVVLSYQHALRAIMEALHDSKTQESGQLVFGKTLKQFFTDEQKMWSFVQSCSIFDSFRAPDGSQAFTDDCDIRVPRLVYTSRTHQQLRQVAVAIAQIGLPCTIDYMGAREHFCINSEIKQSDVGLAFQCKYMCKHGACAFNDQGAIQSNIPQLQFLQNMRVWDIEDFTGFCKNKSLCPYYMSSAFSRVAQVVLAPYNYVFASGCSNFQGLLENAVVVVDEAHNLPALCTEGMERAFSLHVIDQLIVGLVQFDIFSKESGQIDTPPDVAPFLKAVQTIRSNLLALANEARFDDVYKQEQYFRHDIARVFGQAPEGFADFGTPEKADAALETALEIQMCYMTNKALRSRVKLLPDIGILIYLLQLLQYSYKFADRFALLITKLEKEPQAALNDSYVITQTPAILKRVSTLFESAASYGRIQFRVICLSPYPLIKTLQERGLGQIILTSGTLSPLGAIDEEFSIKLQFKHSYKPIANSQYAYIITSYKQNQLLGTFQNRTQKTYIDGVREILEHTCESLVRGGVIAFFTSYTVMEQFYGRFERKNVSVFCEQRQQQRTIEQIEAFRRETALKTAILFAVLKGRASEGADFPDDCCRAVIVVSLPFAPARDPSVVEKAKYCREQYVIDAVRAVSQAAGRAVRHSQDFGAILLVDSRFSRMKAQLPSWAATAKVCDFADVNFEGLNQRILARMPQQQEKQPTGAALTDTPQKRLILSVPEKLAARRKLFSQFTEHQKAIFKALWRMGCNAVHGSEPERFAQVWARERVHFNSEQETVVLALFCDQLTAFLCRNFE